MKRLTGVAILAMLSLTACGGGGSSGGTGGGTGGSGGGTVTPQPFTASVNTIGTMSEGQSAQLVFTTSNATAQVSTTVESTAGLTITKVNETTYTIAAPADVDRNISYALTWSAQDGTDSTRKKTGTQNVAVNNVSFDAALSTISTFADSLDRLIGFTEEKMLISALKDVADVLGNSETNVASASIEPQDIASLTASIESVSKGQSDYAQGKIADTELMGIYSDAVANLNTVSTPYKNELNHYLAIIAQDGKARVTAGDYIINADLGSVSMFTGNTDLGAINAGQWVFNENVAYLGGLLANTGCGM